MKHASEPFSRHDECTVFVAGIPEKVFAFADDHSKVSAHMSVSSWMMLGGKMTTATDAERGQNVGSHITMTGNVLGIQLSLDEVVVERPPPVGEGVGDDWNAAPPRNRGLPHGVPGAAARPGGRANCVHRLRHAHTTEVAREPLRTRVRALVCAANGCEC